MSRLVGELEQRLGVRPLQRTTRRLSLTGEGEVFLDRCRDLLSGVGDAEAEVTQHAGEVLGELRISAPVTFGLMHLAPLWPVFMAQHPKLTLDVTLGDRFVDLVDEGYDLAIRIAQLPNSSLVSRQLASARLILCATPKYVRRTAPLASPSDLSNHPAFAYKLLTSGDQWHFSGQDGPTSVKVIPRMRSNSGDSCREAALQHQGIVLQPLFLVGAQLESGELIEVLPQYRSLELGIYAVYPSRKQLSPKVRRLVDFLVESFRKPAWPQ